MAEVQKLTERKLRESDRRMTPQRQAVLKALVDLSEEHPTAEEVYQVARQYCSTVGMATVYRSLELFVQMGIISKAPTLDGTTRYELSKEPHDHFVCLKCGRTYEVNVGEKPKENEELAKEGFKVLNVSTVYFGYCPDCLSEK